MKNEKNETPLMLCLVPSHTLSLARQVQPYPPNGTPSAAGAACAACAAASRASAGTPPTCEGARVQQGDDDRSVCPTPSRHGASVEEVRLEALRSRPPRRDPAKATVIPCVTTIPGWARLRLTGLPSLTVDRGGRASQRTRAVPRTSLLRTSLLRTSLCKRATRCLSQKRLRRWGDSAK